MADTNKTKLLEATGVLLSPQEGGNGRYRIRIIETDRWGSSAYYPSEVTKRDGPSVFGPGTQMFIDHPTLSEDWERPERSVKDLIGVIESTPEWNDETKSLDADVRFFKQYVDMIDDIKENVGISINAFATVEEGEVDGRWGNIVTSFLSAQSVDVVTKAGAGGAILQAIESATGRKPQVKEKQVADTTVSTDTLTKLTAAVTALTEAFEKDRDERALAAKEAEDASPKPLEVALAVAGSGLPKAYMSRVFESIEAGSEVETAIKEAKAELDEVIKEVNEAAKAKETKPAVQIGAPKGESALRETVSYGEVDISPENIDRLLERLTKVEGK